MSEYNYRIELHAHTNPVSRCSEIPPEELVNTYKALGCDAVAITNHFTPDIIVPDRGEDGDLEFYFNDFLRAKAEGDRIGIKVIFGMEIRFAENSNDYLIYGVDFDEARKIYPYLRGTLAQFRAGYKNPRSVFLQAHPFRSGMIQMDPALLDGIEAFNMHPHHNSRVSIAAKYAQEHNMIATCGTDFHHRGHEGVGITLAKTLPCDSYELAALIKSRDYLFDIGGFVVSRA